MKTGEKGLSFYVQIAGIGTLDEALHCEAAGASAIGLLVGQRHASRDFLGAARAQALAVQLRDRKADLRLVLITHLTRADEIFPLLQQIPADRLQLHSEISVAEIARLRGRYPLLPLIKSYHVENEGSLTYGKRYADTVDFFILDTLHRATGQVGGTGRTHDWQLSRKIAERYAPPTILAGGLTADNVSQAIRTVHPCGVDVNTGVKDAQGKLSTAKLQAFVQASRRAAG